jgi:hypothetical protein
MIALPTVVEPMKLTQSTAGCDEQLTALDPPSTTTLRTPAGSPTASAASPMTSVAIG